MQLVLSLFPGIGLLDMAFEAEGFCVVRGPDVLWGGDVRRFHPPAGRFDGVIGGPPCQAFSSLAHLNRGMGVEPKFGNLVPEFARCVAEAMPSWFVMENVPAAPEPVVDRYGTCPFLLDNSWLIDDGGIGQKQKRLRKFTFGMQGRQSIVSVCNGKDDGRECCPNLLRWVDLATFRNQHQTMAVTGNARVLSVGGTIRRNDNGKQTGPGYSKRISVEESARLQGLPDGFLEHCPFNESAKRQMIGNGVPLPMGRAIAKAVKEATCDLAQRVAAQRKE